MSDDTKSRSVYPQHLTREALAEALINTPYGAPFSEAAFCEAMLRPGPFDFTALAQWAPQISQIFDLVCDAISSAVDALADLADVWAGIVAEPTASNFAEALAAKNKHSAAKGSERSRNAVRTKPRRTL